MTDQSTADPQPALDSLVESQRELFDELRAGFDDRRGIVLWCHRASVRTLGQLPDGWAVGLLSNRWRVAALLDDPTERRRMLDRAPTDRQARDERRLIADDELLKASRDAMQVLGQNATEYLEDVTVDTGKQRYLAMRPALDDLVSRQRSSLKRALGIDGDPHGLETHDDVSRWVRGVIRATKGVDGGITSEAVWSLVWKRALTGDVRSPTLHLLLADDVLRVMNRSIRETATASREAVAEETTSHGALDT